jgi:putative hydrolase of the HAD superfamily
MSLGAVCFDLDDTLYDYHQYARAGLRNAADRLQRLTGRELHDELLDLYFCEGVTEGTFDRLVDRYCLPDSLVEDLVAAFHESTAPLTPYAGAESVLDSLAGEYRLGLVTDGRGGEAKLRRLNLVPYFDTVLVTPTVGSSKRDRAVFEWTLADLSVAPPRAVYVGDDPRVDFRGPNELGMTTVRLRRGRYASLEPTADAAAPDTEIDCIADLPAALADCEVPVSGEQ